MSMLFESGAHRLTVRGDFENTQAKRTAMFAASLLAPGSTMPSELDPHSFEDVEVVVAKDVMSQEAAALCMRSHIDLDIR